jgi:hypothetical protein
MFKIEGDSQFQLFQTFHRFAPFQSFQARLVWMQSFVPSRSVELRHDHGGQPVLAIFHLEPLNLEL